MKMVRFFEGKWSRSLLIGNLSPSEIKPGWNTSSTASLLAILRLSLTVSQKY